MTNLPSLLIVVDHPIVRTALAEAVRSRFPNIRLDTAGEAETGIALNKAELKKNSLIVVFTNGLHSRSPFEKENSNRKVVFMHYGAFDKVSLFKYSNYNKNK